LHPFSTGPADNKITQAYEYQEVLNRYNELRTAAKTTTRSHDAEKRIEQAFRWAWESHKDIRRKSGEFYIHHPINVAKIVIEEIGLGTTSIISALLHDMVEDTEVTLEEIEERFGYKVANIVKGLTKLSKHTSEWGVSQQAENFRKVLLTFSNDIRVIHIKLADRLDNMRSLQSLPRQKQLKISSETQYVYIPLAHRLGLYRIKSELEDLCLKYTNAESYYDIAQKLNLTKAERRYFIKEFTRPIEKALKENGFKFSLKRRTKSIFSIWNKMRSKKVPFEQIYDLVAVRIILEADLEEEKKVCWQVYSILTDLYKPNPERLRDWINTPKSNGYESLHTTLMSYTGQWVEVQIRTTRMNDIAEKGYAAHWKYKEKYKETGKKGQDTHLVSNLDKWVNEVRSLLEQEKKSAVEFIDEFKFVLYNEEIYVYTPKGDPITLPKDTTVLDFAFAVHTELGMQCKGAYINQQFVPIDHKLENGDQVKIVSTQGQTPSEAWLGFVVSSRARRNIREALKEKSQAAEAKGKQLLHQYLQQHNLPTHTQILEQIREFFSERTLEKLYQQLSTGIKKVEELRTFKETVDSLPNIASQPVIHSNNIFTVLEEGKGALFTGETNEMRKYILADCCTPIPGDDIFGVITASQQIKVHRNECPNSLDILSHQGPQTIKAQWSYKEKSSLVNLLIEGHQSLNLSDLMEAIAKEKKVTIQAASFDVHDKTFRGKVTLHIPDAKHLQALIKNINYIQGIFHVKRVSTSSTH